MFCLQAKKQASIRWLVTKALAHLSARKVMEDPFKESKKVSSTNYEFFCSYTTVSFRLVGNVMYVVVACEWNQYNGLNNVLHENMTVFEVIPII